MKEIAIEEVYFFRWIQGLNQRQFHFKTRWRKKKAIHLYYNTLDSVITKEGFYKKDENSNEIWGVGNNWALMNERNLIDAKQ